MMVTYEPVLSILFGDSNNEEKESENKDGDGAAVMETANTKFVWIKVMIT